MCRCVNLLLLLFSICRRGVSSLPAMKVRPGENITLPCDLAPSTMMFWYRHIGRELSVILSATNGNLDKEMAVDHNADPEHFQALIPKGSGHALNVSLSLIIMDVRQSDIGLYYCGAKQNISGAVYLHFTDAVEDPQRSAQCRTSLIPVCGVLAAALGLCLAGIFIREFSSVFCRKCVKNDDTKDSDLHYASLRHSPVSRERLAPPADHSVTYDTIA